MIKHLTLESVLAIHDAVLSAHGGMPGLREESLLESAIAAPQATFGGEPIMSDIIEIGAAYLYYLCKNHPFLDGNKRTALASCLVVLSENGQLPSMELDIDDWEQLVLDVASSSINRQTTTVRLQSILT
ncbi:type II toxin-antitoxin system death-on-curing family toxin [Verrucomicrobiaceae bacterium 5K15]|uniref:Type II toxin-antitoxin system death-on-curing family toxin n=1 Tax=Oceaniferula flava TaxID=2800421 RepID=A0AAE2VDI3_9BACT|nr:type II toxin-antitoxin system death-on-curing family toxin [Oceaniferula flavus]MBK1856106.1 type II toxin-antitoxin system death-on-curing family toxin [Oceaniferula flavus]MBM1137413.1 type II toxin-antitoxin system death-on-curing family toxin [Oceaniferula flavus]